MNLNLRSKILPLAALFFLTFSFCQAAPPDKFWVYSLPYFSGASGSVNDVGLCDADVYPDILGNKYNTTISQDQILIWWGSALRAGPDLYDSPYTDTTVLPITLPTDCAPPFMCRFGDINKNGKLDVVYHHANGTQKILSVCYNQDSRAFSASQNLVSFTVFQAGEVFELNKVADIDGDGWPDIVVSYTHAPGKAATRIFWNNNGTFSASDYTEWLDWSPGPMAAFTTSGRQDLVLQQSGVGFKVALQTSPRIFATSGTYSFNGKINLACDLKHAGRPDLLGVKNNSSGSIVLWNEVYAFLNAGDGSFPDSSLVYHDTASVSVLDVGETSGDIDGDTHPDFIISEYGGTSTWSQAWYTVKLLSDAVGFETQLIDGPATSHANHHAIYIGDVNGDGITDVVANEGTGGDYPVVIYGYNDSGSGGGGGGGDSGGGGGGPVGPLAVGISALLSWCKRKKKFLFVKKGGKT